VHACHHLHLAVLLGPGGLTICCATAIVFSAHIDGHRVNMFHRGIVVLWYGKLLVTVLYVSPLARCYRFRVSSSYLT